MTPHEDEVYPSSANGVVLSSIEFADCATPPRRNSTQQQLTQNLTTTTPSSSSVVSSPTKRQSVKFPKASHQQSFRRSRTKYQFNSYADHQQLQQYESNNVVDEGDYILELLQHNPFLQEQRRRTYRPCRSKDDDKIRNDGMNQEKFRFTPLISIHNLHVVQRWLYESYVRFFVGQRLEISSRLFSSSPLRWIAESMYSIILSVRRCIFYKDHDRSWWRSIIVIFTSVVPLTVSAVAIAANIFFIYCVQFMIAVVVYLMTFLIDWNDIRQLYDGLCPRQLKFLVTFCYNLPSQIDSLILLGNRFVGREWNENDFYWTVHNPETSFVWRKDGISGRIPAVSCQDSTTLWDLPPPTVSLSMPPVGTESIQNKLNIRSDATMKHVAAIDFCYNMLSEDNVCQRNSRKSKKKIRRQNKRFLREHRKSIPIDQSLTEKNTDEGTVPNPIEKRRAFLSSVVRSMSRDKSIGRGRKNWQKLRLHKRDAIPGISANTGIEATAEYSDTSRPESPSSLRESIELKMKREESSNLDDDSIVDRWTLSSENILSDDEYYSGREELDIRSLSSIPSDADLPWIDVGVKVGKLLLNSAHVQRAMASQETTDRILGIGANFGSGSEIAESSVSTNVGVSRSETSGGALSDRKIGMSDNISKPIHPMWTSPAAAGSAFTSGIGSIENDDAFSLTENPLSPMMECPTSPSDDKELPPLSPRRPRINAKQSTLFGAVPSHSVQIIGQQELPSEGDFTLGHAISEDVSVEVSISENASPPGRRTETPCRKRYDLSDITEYSSRSVCSRNLQDCKSRRMAESPSVNRNEITRSAQRFRRAPLKPGVKVAVPLFPRNPNTKWRSSRSAYLMASVVSSTRIFISKGTRDPTKPNETNCLSVTAKIEQFFLRKGEFADITFRVLDEWGPRYMPRHSKVPVGSCVATKFGIGVLVGWRIEDDCHVVRSLWQRRGPGTAHAYLNRQAILCTIECAIGFRVETTHGYGDVRGCVDVRSSYKNCRFCVSMKEDGRSRENILYLKRHDIISCNGAQFIPVTEHLREAANYQIQIDHYYAYSREQRLNDIDVPVEHEFQMKWAVWAEILWSSFLKAVSEDTDFDNSVNDIINSFVDFLEKLDKPADEDDIRKYPSDEGISPRQQEFDQKSETVEPGFWIMDDLFGGVFSSKKTSHELPEKSSMDEDGEQKSDKPKVYDRIYGILRILMKTVSIARASSVDHPHLRLALAIGYDFLLFLRTVTNVQQQNFSEKSMDVWKRAWGEIVATFGPLKDRLEKIGRGIAQRMKAQGRKAKVRVLRFADRILSDERLLVALEQGDWDRCVALLEIALVEAHVIERENVCHYRKTGKFLYDYIHLVLTNEGRAASRNSEKLAIFGKFVQMMAKPRRSILKFLCQDDVLELFERILVRAYCKEEIATRMLTIHAANFHTLRHLRMLKYFPVAGRIWIPLLDAADEEFSYLVSKLPENSKIFMCPLSSLFSLCVAQFHKINAGDLSKDWLAFLLEEDAATIIHDIDVMLLLALESFSRDVREMMDVLPYYSSIDDDILNLMDEVDLDQFLKEASDALDDSELLTQFIRDKATIAIERFLNYLPKLSIPVEKRELGDGWVLTCRGEDGGDLTLSDVNIKRENLVCQIMGGDTLFFPLFGDDDAEILSTDPLSSSNDDVDRHVEESILDQIRVLIINAHKYGCWRPGFGGVRKPSNDPYVSAALHGMPISSVLNSAIDLWRNLELDDDELLEIAIRDVSYQIQLEKESEEGYVSPDLIEPVDSMGSWADGVSSASSFGSNSTRLHLSRSSESGRHRFNPRIDPTVLYLEIKNLNLNLRNFQFRIEKNEKKTLFDPIFEGKGMLSLENVSVRLRIDCAKERSVDPATNVDVSSPILLLQELEVGLGKLRMKVKDTGFGSDWLLNKAVDVFEDNITKVVEENLKEQIYAQVKSALDSLNSYFVINPNLFLNILGISMDDLDENVVWVR